MRDENTSIRLNFSLYYMVLKEIDERIFFLNEISTIL